MPSPLQRFTQAAYSISSAIIGTESLSISGGAAINGVLNESSHRKEYENGGFEQTGDLEFVIDVTAFRAAYADPYDSYRGKIVATRGQNWRIEQIRAGGPSDGQFVILSLITPNKSA